jgi:hypothetical protein
MFASGPFARPNSMTNNENPNSAGPIAGEGIKDAARWPGFLLVAAGLAALALGLAGLAVGHSSAGTAGIAISAIALGLGVFWQFVEHRRNAGRITGSTPERPEDAGAL